MATYPVLLRCFSGAYPDIRTFIRTFSDHFSDHLIYFVLSTLINRKLPDYVFYNIRIYFYFRLTYRTFVENI